MRAQTSRRLRWRWSTSRQPVDAGLSGFVFEPPLRLQEFDQRCMRIDLDQALRRLRSAKRIALRLELRPQIVADFSGPLLARRSRGRVPRNLEMRSRRRSTGASVIAGATAACRSRRGRRAARRWHAPPPEARRRSGVSRPALFRRARRLSPAPGSDRRTLQAQRAASRNPPRSPTRRHWVVCGPGGVNSKNRALGGTCGGHGRPVVRRIFLPFSAPCCNPHTLNGLPPLCARGQGWGVAPNLVR